MEPTGRPNLSIDLAAKLRAMIVDGHLEGRLNEVHLAAEVGVSRTPLREALTTLSSEGFLTSIPRRGFFVPPLSLDEFKQLYVMRAVLDPMALEIAGLPGARQLARLEKLNERIRSSRNPTRTIELDDQWHLLLLEPCSNQILIDLIRHFIHRTRRYEHAYLRETEHVAVASDEHERIQAACRHGDLGAACAALRQNMQSGMDPLLRWLQARDPKRPA